jgi:hypothetical protein
MYLLLLALLGAAQPQPPDCVVVCPAVFRKAIEPWIEYRVRQGHAISLVAGELPAEEIRRQIRTVGQGGRLRFVVLVGDCAPTANEGPEVRQRCVLTHYDQAEVNTLWGSEPYLSSDNWYADLDDDTAPDVALGRLTADTPEELGRMVAKTLAYEQSRDFGPWRRQLNLVAGLGGFGALADAAIEAAARYFILRGIPASYNLSTTFANWNSPYCPDPRRLRATVIERLNEGAWLWVYIGHGNPWEVDRARLPGGIYPMFSVDDAGQLQARHGAPLALFLSCYTGAMDAMEDCLAERMLREPGGPVAVIAGTRVTMPYGMGVLATELMTECFGRNASTVGEALLAAKRKMIHPPPADSESRAMLDTVAAAISPRADLLANERAEHVRMFHLFGDPMLRLRFPRALQLTVNKQCKAGEALPVVVASPIEGLCRVELIVAPGRLTFPPPSKPLMPTSEAFNEVDGVYKKANDLRLSAIEATIAGGPLDVRLGVPSNARGPCCVRVYVEGADDFAMGVAPVEIHAESESEEL